ncbi:hypothetical protein ASPZODRAFT_72416 [Penicilliopsis zonata CBS 506.65]|uniref:Zn(2)-C6 fungal-type domain-containing protein n=1 Tax=Penicilliopsis zonata CBS 506.65 TaxID=1073090 RepID=A0A1L9S9Y4_9EURO|nr:hypothetical protein ASPZODRAFT_72416 [Penicilliopsis zonata CBS 506.65]OJJ43946.1 hypothetical protein ASPZODRAFT_72416 [Penicilliopsis zonata CBS 506.65]
MPRRRAADREGPVNTRTRSGCQGCRASRVRCDESKPACGRCRRRGLECSTQVVMKWESEFASRGLAFGRAGVWSKQTPGGSSKRPSRSPSSPTQKEQEWCLVPHIGSWAFVNSGIATFEESCRVLVGRDMGSVCSAWDFPANYDNAMMGRPVPEIPRSLSVFGDISVWEHGQMFDYYLHQVCPRTTPSCRATSPFASIILPFCLTASPALFKAIQALGACHWSRFDGSYSVLGLRLKSEALRDLRRRLSDGSLVFSADPEVLVIMMMLCLYEIVDDCDQHWTIHLQGAKALIRQRRQQVVHTEDSDSHRSLLDPVTAFAESFFAFQDVMGRTACGEEVNFGSDHWPENEQTVDLWMGCSPELVSILSSITELSRTRRLRAAGPASAQFTARAASLRRRLESLVQKLDGDGKDETLEAAAELKRLSAILYLHCSLYGSSPQTPLVADYVRKILRSASHLLDRGVVASITWPIFVAAVELDPAFDELWSEEHGPEASAVYGRPLVLRALAAMAQSSVSNVARTRAVIIKVWQSRDGDMLKAASAECSGSACNDWERYVAPISTAMSLA